MGRHIMHHGVVHFARHYPRVFWFTIGVLALVLAIAASST
jgi:hypothetical protein